MGFLPCEWTRSLARIRKKKVQKTNHLSRKANLSAWLTAFVYKFLWMSSSPTQFAPCFLPSLRVKMKVLQTQITSAQLKTTHLLVVGRTCHLTTWTSQWSMMTTTYKDKTHPNKHYSLAETTKTGELSRLVNLVIWVILRSIYLPGQTLASICNFCEHVLNRLRTHNFPTSPSAAVGKWHEVRNMFVFGILIRYLASNYISNACLFFNNNLQGFTLLQKIACIPSLHFGDDKCCCCTQVSI